MIIKTFEACETGVEEAYIEFVLWLDNEEVNGLTFLQIVSNNFTEAKNVKSYEYFTYNATVLFRE